MWYREKGVLVRVTQVLVPFVYHERYTICGRVFTKWKLMRILNWSECVDIFFYLKETHNTDEKKYTTADTRDIMDLAERCGREIKSLCRRGLAYIGCCDNWKTSLMSDGTRQDCIYNSKVVPVKNFLTGIVVEYWLVVQEDCSLSLETWSQRFLV